MWDKALHAAAAPNLYKHVQTFLGQEGFQLR